MTIDDSDRDRLMEHRVRKAEETIREVDTLIINHLYNTAMNRIYYGMFYAISALALKYQFSTSKHHQLIGWFNKEFVKTGKVNQKFGKVIKAAFEMRSSGDYDDFVSYTATDVLPYYAELKDFIGEIKRLIDSAD